MVLNIDTSVSSTFRASSTVSPCSSLDRVKQMLTLPDPTPSQTKEDLATIRKLIRTYMKNKRTIILLAHVPVRLNKLLLILRAVMDALNNLANQEVFSMAKAADPEGKRTVGIITKCDAVSKGDEQPVLSFPHSMPRSLFTNLARSSLWPRTEPRSYTTAGLRYATDQPWTSKTV